MKEVMLVMKIILISFIRNDVDKDRKYKCFVIKDSNGLTKAGLLNQSTE